MEVKPEYKQTEVGVIPEDWKTECVGRAFDICNNLRMPISQAIRETMTGSYPYYGPTAIQGYINEYRVEGEYALIGEDGDHFLKWEAQSMTQLIRGRFNVNNHAHLIKGTKNLTSWFYYYFSHRDLTPYLTRQGAGRYKLTKSTLTEVPCALPPTLAEQEAIAEALSDADALIESLEQLIAKKRHIKQGAMQELLTGKRRLPGFEVKPGYKQTENGEIPADWNEARIRDVCRLINGRGFKPFEWKKTGLPIIRIQNLNGSNEFNYFDGSYDKKLEVYPGQLLFAWSGSRGTSFGPHLWCGPLGLLNYHTWKVLSIDSAISKAFFFHSLRKLTQFIEERAHGASALVHTQKWEMEGFSIPLPPPLAEQEAIAEALSDMDAEIDSLESKLSKARQIKQGMMQELLTGRIRLV